MRTLLFCLFSALSLSAQTRHIQPDGLSKPTTYTHVVAASGKETVYVSGQVSADAKGQIVGKGDLKAQTAQAMENLKIALAAAGCTFDHVVKMTTFVVNFKAADLAALREIRSRYLNPAKPPASTLLGVQALANPDYLIEIEAIAVK
ncbi:MAG: RidA family protein [Bryobacteraceae bacterium]|nr:RidA family protein [Bryobacteraceae bacterium]